MPVASVDSECPCAGAWASHGDYVSCVARVAGDLRGNGTITGREHGAIVSAAARSECGRVAAAVCGNGITESGEQCDDSNTVGGDGCSATCIVETSSGEACRNLVDDDGDMLADCADPDCSADAICNDADLDGVANASDNCTTIPNPGQTDTDGGGIGDACENRIVSTPGGPCFGRNSALLADGRVLLLGVWSGGARTNQAWLYDPVGDTLVRTGDAASPHIDGGMATLRDGSVLVAGGSDASGDDIPRTTAERYFPATGTFAPTAGPLNVARATYATVMLDDGRVLAVGGLGYPPGGAPNTTLDRYDPATDSFTLLTSTLSAAGTGGGQLAAAKLTDGRVLITGGAPGVCGNSASTANAAIYDPLTDSITATTGDMNVARQYHEIVALSDGSALVVGGMSSGCSAALVPALEVERYDPLTGVFTVEGTLSAGRTVGGISPLADGDVLAAGGFTGGTGLTATVDRIDDATFSPSAVTPLLAPRSNIWKTARLLHDGSILLPLGSSPDYGTLACNSERYFPDYGDTVIDVDADGVVDVLDNCPAVLNSAQTDSDADGVGDACDCVGCADPRGKIVFKSDRSGAPEVWTMRDDGSGLFQVTSFGTDVHHPRWSKDGTRIAFFEGPWDNANLYTVNADGSGLALLVPAGAIGGIDAGNHGTCWSFDESKLFFAGYSPVNLYEVDTATGVATLSGADRSSGEESIDCHPSLPRIVYFNYYGGGPGGDDGVWWDTFTGGSATRLTPTLNSDWGTRWSSNGASVLFRRYYVTDPVRWVDVGSGVVTAIPGSDWITDWSMEWGPDDAWAIGSHWDGTRHQLYRMRTDGAWITRLTDGTSSDFYADWHPGDRDADSDGILDWQDNCVIAPNASQTDSDADGIGNACEP